MMSSSSMTVTRRAHRIAKRGLLRTGALAALLLFGPIVGGQGYAARADDLALARHRLVSELSATLLDADAPFLSLAGNQGWLGVVLAQPGASLIPLAEAYDVRPNGSPGLAQFLANEAVLDRPIIEKDGLAFFQQRSLADVWNDLLVRSVPKTVPNLGAKIPSEIQEVLFAPADDVDRARGLAPVREPSAYFVKYREYEALYDLVRPGAGEGAWRIHPRLAGYTSIELAREAVMEDWIRFGYKAEVEAAETRLRRMTRNSDWAAWAYTKALFDLNQLPDGNGVSLPETFIFPSPGSWSNVGTWIRAHSKFNDSVEISFELCRVKIQRPWLRLEGLLDGSLKVDTTDARNAGYMLSDGAPPTYEKSPEGQLAMFPVELLLVRNIRLSSSATDALDLSSNPLTLFAYPDAINLLGYVVHVLPKYPR